MPFSVLYDPSVLAEVVPIIPILGRNPYRTNVLGDPLVEKAARTVGRWLDRTKASIPDLTQPFGNSGRNLLRGPGFFQLDFGIYKNFDVTEPASVQFRGELFNATNRTNLGLPNSNAGNAGFGAIRGAYDPRPVQFARKLAF